MIEVYHQALLSLDSRQNLCMVFCDISKAFDRVWHKGLVFELSQLGISGSLLSWLKDYLSCRSHSVIVNIVRLRSRSMSITMTCYLQPIQNSGHVLLGHQRCSPSEFDFCRTIVLQCYHCLRSTYLAYYVFGKSRANLPPIKFNFSVSNAFLRQPAV